MTDRLDWASDAIRLIEQDGAAARRFYFYY